MDLYDWDDQRMLGSSLNVMEAENEIYTDPLIPKRNEACHGSSTVSLFLLHSSIHFWQDVLREAVSSAPSE